MTERKLDAVLLHFYSQPDTRGHKLDLRNHMQVSAILAKYKKGEVGHIFIAGAATFDDKVPSVSQLMERDLTRRGVLSEDIIIDPRAMDTKTEVILFAEEAKRQGWKSLATIANMTHLKRINIILRQLELTNIKTNSAEQILTDSSSRYYSFLRNFAQSSREFLFGIREKIVVSLYSRFSIERVDRFAKNSFVQRIKNYLDR